MIVREDKWVLHAACRHMNPAMFHPHKEDGATAARALLVCGGCPVKNRCLERALEHGADAMGIWGGTTEKQRREKRRAEGVDIRGGRGRRRMA